MIDNEEKARALMDQMTAALPFRVRLTAENLRSMKREWPDLETVGAVEVKELIYTGDMGGIMCLLEFGAERDSGGKPDEVQIVSITHLKFSRSQPFWREVDKYQKRRIKRLRLQDGLMPS